MRLELGDRVAEFGAVLGRDEGGDREGFAGGEHFGGGWDSGELVLCCAEGLRMGRRWFG